MFVKLEASAANVHQAIRGALPKVDLSQPLNESKVLNRDAVDGCEIRVALRDHGKPLFVGIYVESKDFVAFPFHFSGLPA